MRHAIIVRTGARTTRPDADRTISKIRLRRRAMVGRPPALAASAAPLRPNRPAPTTTCGLRRILFLRLSAIEPVDLHFLAVQRRRTDHEITRSPHHDASA